MYLVWGGWICYVCSYGWWCVCWLVGFFWCSWGLGCCWVCWDCWCGILEWWFLIVYLGWRWVYCVVSVVCWFCSWGLVWVDVVWCYVGWICWCWKVVGLWGVFLWNCGEIVLLIKSEVNWFFIGKLIILSYGKSFFGWFVVLYLFLLFELFCCYCVGV